MCEAGCEVLVAHGAGSGEHEDKQIRRCRAPIVGFAPRVHYDRGWESHPMVFNWGRGHGGCLVRGHYGRGGEGMGRGNGESITARAMTSRYTDVSKTNQRPAFVAYLRKEVCMHPHAEKCVCTPTRQRIRTHIRDIPGYVLSFFLLGFEDPT